MNTLGHKVLAESRTYLSLACPWVEGSGPLVELFGGQSVCLDLFSPVVSPSSFACLWMGGYCLLLELFGGQSAVLDLFSPVVSHSSLECSNDWVPFLSW
mgnify:CR=1 FL=1